MVGSRARGENRVMSDPSLQLPLTDIQRDRAVEHLQRVYAAGGIDEADFESRLSMALTAQNRAELNASLKGLARIAPAVMDSQTVAQTGPHHGPANVISGFIHLTALPSLMLVPAIATGVSRPGGRIAVEAHRAMSFQLSAVVYGLGAAVFVFLQLLPTTVLGVGFLGWLAMTFWLAVRAFSGEKSTTYVEWLMLTKPREDRKPRKIR